MKKTSFAGFASILVFILSLTAACSDSGNSSPPQEYNIPSDADFSSQGWAEAFDRAYARMSREYAFTSWKNIDFEALHAEFYPRIVAAEASHDARSYYLAIREFLAHFNDGHISFPAMDEDIRKEEIGGSYGLAIVKLDDGRFIAARLLAGGSAEAQGILQGAEILSWDGMSVEEATAGVKTIWGAAPPATMDYARIVRLNYLVRAPVDTMISVVYRNPGSPSTASAMLTATDDSYQNPEIIQWFARRPDANEKDRMIDYCLLPQGYGYIALYLEADLSNLSSYPQRIYDKFAKALLYFNSNRARGLILDIRANIGGSDQLAADICGFFSRKKLFYEETEMYDANTGEFVRAEGRKYIIPQNVHYDGYVAVLVSPGDVSSGEGVAMGIKKLPKGTVIGFNGTNGSFGVVGVHITLPGPYTFRYAYGRSLDSKGIVQVDSNAEGIGGVMPDIRVPATYDNIIALANGTDVELEYAIDYLDSIIR